MERTKSTRTYRDERLHHGLHILVVCFAACDDGAPRPGLARGVGYGCALLLHHFVFFLRCEMETTGILTQKYPFYEGDFDISNE